MNNTELNTDPSGKEWSQVMLLICASLLLGLYLLFRYQGLWAENDTTTFSKAIQSVLTSQRLFPEKNLYSNGYGYQTLFVFLADLSRIDVRALQQIVAPLLICWVVLPAWLAYRELTGSSRIASLATVILFIQPEFLFPLLRGSHEKFTRGLMFLCIYLLARSLRTRGNLRRFTGFLLAFYLSAYALITFNNLMAFSFIIGIALALVLFWVISSKKGTNLLRMHATSERLLVVTISLIIVAFLFTFYAYPPAVEQLRLLNSVQDRVSSLVLQVEDSSTNPYNVVNAGWISLPVYLLVSLANWILLVGSGLIWLHQSFQWLVRKKRLDEQDMFLWALYGAFAFQGALSIIIDFSGAIGANLQHRIFPSFAMLGAPLIAKWLYERKASHQSARDWVWIISWVTITLLAFFSTFKATLEPMLSNNWIFYKPAEISALNWAFDNNRSASVWSDFNERLTTAYGIENGDPPNLNLHDIANPDQGTDNYLISNINRKRSERLGSPLPLQADSLRIYDNGDAAIYHRRPVTPYQH
jgi:hypothetical protein